MALRLSRAVLLVVGYVSLVLPASARAQGGLWSVTATGKYAHLTEDEGFPGTGVGAGVGVEWRVTERTALAVDVSAVRHVNDLEFFAMAFDGNSRPSRGHIHV